MDALKGKKILLVALGGYSNGIIEKMKDMGAQVDYINDKPNDGIICKSFGRLKFKPYMKVIDNYYIKKIESLKNNKYDYILVIRGEYTTKKALVQMRKTYPNAKLILYMWDSLRNNKGIEKLWKYYDKVYTFDRIDYLDNKEKIQFLPLYYYEDILPKSQSQEIKYDVAFIGTGHEDRVKIVNSVAEQCRKEGLRVFFYIFLPHKMVFLYNKILNSSNYKGVSGKQINYKMLPFKTAYEIYGSSKCIMDIESSTQCGLTMRTIEMIGMNKKIITTNQNIKKYDFYNPDNIAIIDRNNIVIPKDFFSKAYCPIHESIYEKYSLQSWILDVID